MPAPPPELVAFSCRLLSHFPSLLGVNRPVPPLRGWGLSCPEPISGIQPHVTLLNYDLPQALEDEYEGWLSRDIIRDFTNYVNVCFREFGDRFKYWTTVNEPNILVVGGYDQGIVPPQRCSPPFCIYNSTRGNSTYEPYLAVHHILLAHSSAVRLYRRKYQDQQHGFVGISIYAFGLLPHTNTEKDRVACQRVRDFYFGWIMEPLLHGDYPITMKANAGARIPAFTSRESEQIKGSYDFIGIIHYARFNVSDNPGTLNTKLRFLCRHGCTANLFCSFRGYIIRGGVPYHTMDSTGSAGKIQVPLWQSSYIHS